MATPTRRQVAYVSIVLLLSWFALPHKYTYAEEPASCDDLLVPTLDRITRSWDRKHLEWHVVIHLWLTNMGPRPVCILPTECSYYLTIRPLELPPGNAGDLFAIARGATGSVSAKSISDIKLPQITILPRESRKVELDMPTDFHPRTPRSHLYLEIRCRPFYEGATYKGVPIYRKPIVIITEYELTQPDATQWVIRPAAPTLPFPDGW